jgi:aspartyl-tRNA(Asn)/glutamyl-tRNA(Gln) amidotransferase subunit C
MTISQEDIQKTAQLAHLAIDDDQLNSLSNQLNDILGYVEKLNELDTKGIEATAHPIPQLTRFRDDIAGSSGLQADLREAAPDPENDYFGVPKI